MESATVPLLLLASSTLVWLAALLLAAFGSNATLTAVRPHSPAQKPLAAVAIDRLLQAMCRAEGTNVAGHRKMGWACSHHCDPSPNRDTHSRDQRQD